MSTVAPNIAPRPTKVTVNDPPSPPEAKQVNARILKKREADRKCQRMIRQRTKSKIAYLEEMVEDFKKKDTSGQVELLMKQLEDTKQERDTLAKKVKNIENILEEGKLKSKELNSECDDVMQQSETTLGVGFEMGTSEDGDAPSSFLSLGKMESEANEDGMLFNDNSAISPSSSVQFMNMRHNSAPHLTADINEQAINHSINDVQISPHMSGSTNIAGYHLACECRAPTQALTRRSPPFNIWRYANEVLSSKFRWPARFSQLKDIYRDDIPIRVALEGWEAVERRGNLHPTWQVLKKIDQAIFWRCEPKERIAVLYTMHQLLEAHTSSNPEPANVLPEFFVKGTKTPDIDSYAINYFIWPGIRSRFVNNQHRYCTNDFWAIFSRNLNVLWPFEMRDCYTRNTQTGLYSISQAFQQRLSDVSTWTMGEEIFQKWPELRTDMPTFHRIPASPSMTRPIQPRRLALDMMPYTGINMTSANTSSIEEDLYQDFNVVSADNLISSSSLQQDLFALHSTPKLYNRTFNDMIWTEPRATQVYPNRNEYNTDPMTMDASLYLSGIAPT